MVGDCVGASVGIRVGLGVVGGNPAHVPNVLVSDCRNVPPLMAETPPIVTSYDPDPQEQHIPSP